MTQETEVATVRIVITPETHEAIKRRKLYPRESNGDVIRRLLKDTEPVHAAS